MSQTIPNYIPMANGSSMTITYPSLITSSTSAPVVFSTDPSVGHLYEQAEDLKATNEDLLEDLAVVVDILRRVAAKRIGKELKQEIEDFLNDY